MSSATGAVKYVWDERPRDTPMALLERQRIIGERAMLSRVVLREGCVVPEHAHENEQFAFVMSGRLRFVVGGGGRERREVVVGAGEVLHLPGGVPHAAEALEETVVLDIFSPPSATTGIDVPGGAGGA